MGARSVYFYCAPAGPPERALYQHTAVCLAEGLRGLGVDVAGDIDYWRLGDASGRHLIERRDDASPDDFDVVVVNDTWFDSGRTLPEGLFRKGRTYATVYLDASDGLRTYAWRPEMREFDAILLAHFNERFVYPDNVRPWAFGLSQRILESVVPAHERRDGRLLFNFRVSSPVRNQARLALASVEDVLPIDDTIDPIDSQPGDHASRLQWSQTGRRHQPAFYERLASASACACFGGWLLSPWPRDQARSDPVSRLLRRTPVGHRRIFQWDSWRLWESLAAGCATFHVDFPRYGATMPVMPENTRQYVGIDLRDARDSAERIREEPSWLSDVGESGRAWALEHYAPVPTARRFLALAS